MHGSHPTNGLTNTFICLRRFYTMTACSDPGIVYVKIPSESDNSTMQIARNSSAEEVQSFARPNSSEHLTGNNDAQDETEEHRKSDDGLIGGDVEMGSIGRDDITRNNSSSRTANPSASAAAGTTGTSSSSGGMKNRITVGGAASANRTAHNSTGALSLLGTPAAPYLPPPAMVECGRCQIDRPRDASHCHYCGVCVKNLDHHCPVCLVL
jgi:septal ring-binding cell division protein DamX